MNLWVFLEKAPLSSVEERLRLMARICAVVASSHRRGQVLGNLPGSLDLQDGRVIETPPSPRLTGSALHYMAPEQVQSRPATSRSDVFSLGVVGYRLFSGRLPYMESDVRLLPNAILFEEPVALTAITSEVSPAVSDVLSRALAKLPTDRYADAHGMLEALRLGRPADFVPVPSDNTPERALSPPLSARDDADPSLQEALRHIEGFLSGRIPRAVVLEELDWLQHTSAVEEVASEVWSWAQREVETHERWSRLGLLYFAIDRLNRARLVVEPARRSLERLRELANLERLCALDPRGRAGVLERARERMDRANSEDVWPEDGPLWEFLKEVGEALSQACPPDERERFRRALEDLDSRPSPSWSGSVPPLPRVRPAWGDQMLPPAMKVTDTTPARHLESALSSRDETPLRLKESCRTISQYLADTIPPLLVADAVDEFRLAEIEGSAAELWAWANSVKKGREPDLASLLYYALMKLNNLALLELMPRHRLLPFLLAVGERLAQALEPHDRERLRRGLEPLGGGIAGTAS